MKIVGGGKLGLVKVLFRGFCKGGKVGLFVGGCGSGWCQGRGQVFGGGYLGGSGTWFRRNC